MTRTRIVVVVCFCLALAAGCLAGYAVGRSRPQGPPPDRRRSWLVDRLDLTPEQREEMKDIWSGVHEQMRKVGRDQRRHIRQRRDEAVQALLTEAQKIEYESIQKTYDAEMEALEVERRKAFDTAVGKTRELLTPEQREKYDQLMKDRPPRRRRGGPGPDDPPPGGDRDHSEPKPQ